MRVFQKPRSAECCLKIPDQTLRALQRHTEADEAVRNTEDATDCFWNRFIVTVRIMPERSRLPRHRAGPEPGQAGQCRSDVFSPAVKVHRQIGTSGTRIEKLRNAALLFQERGEPCGGLRPSGYLFRQIVQSLQQRLRLTRTGRSVIGHLQIGETILDEPDIPGKRHQPATAGSLRCRESRCENDIAPFRKRLKRCVAKNRIIRQDHNLPCLGEGHMR